MKKFSVFHDFGKQEIFNRFFSFLIQYRSIGLFNKMRKIDIHRAYFFTGLAVSAVLYNRPGVFLAVVKKGQNQTDSTDVNMTIFMSPHLAVDRADIGTSPATDTSEGFRKNSVPGQGQPSIVQKNNMYYFTVRRSRTAFGSTLDPGDIRGNRLAGCISRKNLENSQHRFQIRNQLVITDECYMNLWQCGCQTHIPFIGNQPECS